MGIIKDAIVGAAGYGIGRYHKKQSEADQRINEIRKMGLRKYLDEYRNANHIVLNTNDADMFIFELRKIADEYEYGT